jgi:putative inorganic carbon (HCO3(-)) transporter
MVVALLILIFLRPFISSLSYPYINSLYSVSFISLLAGWIIIKRIPLKKIRPLFSPLLFLCLALFISVIFSVNKLNSLKELYKYANGLLLFIFALTLDDKDRTKLIRVIVFSAFIISILAIYQYFLGFRHLSSYITAGKITDPFVLDYVGRQRAFFPFVTPNILGGYLAMLIPLALITKDKGWFLVFLTLALLLTKSLGALLSLLFALGLYFYLQGKLKKRNIILLSIVMLTIGIMFILRSLAQKQHFQPIFSTIMRLNYWKDAFMIIKASPLFGVGLGNFNLIHSRYAHNSYLQIWAEMGLLGIISILWLVATMFKCALQNIKDSPHKKQIIRVLAAAVVFLIHNFIDFSFFLPEVSLVWWVTMGLLLYAA